MFLSHLFFFFKITKSSNHNTKYKKKYNYNPYSLIDESEPLIDREDELAG